MICYIQHSAWSVLVTTFFSQSSNFQVYVNTFFLQKAQSFLQCLSCILPLRSINIRGVNKCDPTTKLNRFNFAIKQFSIQVRSQQQKWEYHNTIIFINNKSEKAAKISNQNNSVCCFLNALYKLLCDISNLDQCHFFITERTHLCRSMYWGCIRLKPSVYTI